MQRLLDVDAVQELGLTLRQQVLSPMCRHPRAPWLDASLALLSIPSPPCE